MFMKVGFIGLGNAGGKLAGSLLRNKHDLTVLDLDKEAAQPFLDQGAKWADSAKEMAQACDLIITCLPSPAASAAVMEGEGGILEGMSEGKIWAEMSTTDADEIKRLAKLVEAKGGTAVECPVSGGCHRAATGNISIFVGGEREAFDRMLPFLKTLGRRILHTGPLGSASILKVMTNYLATANLITMCEAMVTMKAAGVDMATTYEVGLFQKIAEDNNVPLEISPMLIDIMKDGQKRYGERANSDDIIRRLEEATGHDILADGFPALLVDDEPEEEGYEVVPRGR